MTGQSLETNPCTLEVILDFSEQQYHDAPGEHWRALPPDRLDEEIARLRQHHLCPAVPVIYELVRNGKVGSMEKILYENAARLLSIV